MSSMTALPQLARRDLTARQAIGVACGILAAVTAVDLLDGRLGFLFSLGFVMAVVTAALAVEVRSMLPTGVLPPLLLVVAIWCVALLFPDAIVVRALPDDAGVLGRTLAGVIDHGITLVIGHGLALVAIVTRIATAPDR